VCCFRTSGVREVGVGFGRAIGQEIDKTHEIMGRLVLLECAWSITFPSSFSCEFFVFFGFVVKSEFFAPVFPFHLYEILQQICSEVASCMYQWGGRLERSLLVVKA
jgi:hypothetical protein